jgi:hypothetical protein
MNKKICTIVGSLALVFLLMTGCVKKPEITKLTGLWKSDQYSGGVIDKMMVVGKPRIEANRVPFENYITKELNKREISVVPSYTVIPAMNDLNFDSVKKAAVDTGVKAVLFTKVVGIDEKEVVFKQSLNYEYTMTPYGMQMAPYMNGPRVETFTKVRLETGLFEVASESLVWAATSAIMDPGSVDEAIKDFSAAIIEQLTKDGYVRPSQKLIGSIN